MLNLLCITICTNVPELVNFKILVLSKLDAVIDVEPSEPKTVKTSQH